MSITLKSIQDIPSKYWLTRLKETVRIQPRLKRQPKKMVSRFSFKYSLTYSSIGLSLLDLFKIVGKEKWFALSWTIIEIRVSFSCSLIRERSFQHSQITLINQSIRTPIALMFADPICCKVYALKSIIFLANFKLFSTYNLHIQNLRIKCFFFLFSDSFFCSTFLFSAPSKPRNVVTKPIAPDGSSGPRLEVKWDIPSTLNAEYIRNYSISYKADGAEVITKPLKNNKTVTELNVCGGTKYDINVWAYTVKNGPKETKDFTTSIYGMC